MCCEMIDGVSVALALISSDPAGMSGQLVGGVDGVLAVGGFGCWPCSPRRRGEG
jgi:hypothetical protein